MNHDELKKFLLEHPFTPEMLERYIKKYHIEGIDIQSEKDKINLKISNLSASKRRAVLELAMIKTVLNEIKQESISKQEIEETANFNTI